MTIQPRHHQSHRPDTSTQWATYLHILADPIVNPLNIAAELEQALAKPFMLAAPLLLHIQHLGGFNHAEQNSKFDTPPTPPPIRAHPQENPDLYLWWALLDPKLDPLQLIDLTASAAIISQDLCTTIEVWTETELATLHAISHHLTTTHHKNNQKLRARLNRAQAWHLENTQPDNATNRPWAVQTFLQANTPESLHYAETLLSNCLVQNAQPDPLSAFILIDAATALALAND